MVPVATLSGFLISIHFLFRFETWFFFFFGAIIGSFLNVCIRRIPNRTFFASARSRCPHCNEKIPFYLNIPILSYLILGGKSQCCHQKIDKEYLIVELLTALFLPIIYWTFPFYLAKAPWLHVPTFLRFIHALTFSSILIICSFIDLKLRIIPDVLSLPMILFSPIVVYFHPDLGFKDSLLGIFLGGGIIYLIAWGYYLVRRAEGMGMGDAKLLAAIGGWLGYQAILPTLFYASILGSIYGLCEIALRSERNLKSEVAFGPFLALGTGLYFFVSSSWQSRLFGLF